MFGVSGLAGFPSRTYCLIQVLILVSLVFSKPLRNPFRASLTLNPKPLTCNLLALKPLKSF